MEKLTAKEIKNYVNGTIISDDPTSREKIMTTDVVIDSREAVKDSVFVALKGEITDGHMFLMNAYEGGARIMLVSDLDMAKEYGKDLFEKKDVAIIQVEDTLTALQDFSHFYLQDMNMRSIAITGSVGKTTTRDLLFSAISGKFKSGTNKKNYNSETGLPLTLLSFNKGMEIGVLEMGMDAPGQIKRLVEIAEPEAAIITNIGISHIERLGSRENIRSAKMEIASNFDFENTLIINDDDDMLTQLDENVLPYKLIRVGRGENCKYKISNIIDKGIEGISFDIELKGPGAKNGNEEVEKLSVDLPVPGAHNAVNAALAIAGAEVMGVAPKDAIKGMKKMRTTGSRMRIIDTPSEIKIIDDAYNAAPSSVRSAMDTLNNTEAKRRIAILGGINELGSASQKEHEKLGTYAAAGSLDMLITIGEMAEWVDKAARSAIKSHKGTTQLLHFETKEDMYPEIEKLFKAGDVILVKASRGYELDKLAEEIAKKF